jgi:hypothetical protein
MADTSVNVVSYRKLFDYACKEYELEWSDCHKIFLSKNILIYEGVSESFWIDDLEMDLKDNTWYQSEYGRGLRIIYNFILDGCYRDGIKFRHY